jgi:hypothetical protein
MQAGTFMHEFGHTLNLRHGGGDNTNNKPNYLSVMNYRSGWQACAVPFSAAGGGAFPGGCAFSATVLPPAPAGPLNESSLDECLGIDNGAGFFGPMNWDAVAAISGISNCSPPNNTNVQADINSSGGSTDMLNGFDDWANIAYVFQNVGSFVNGIANPVDDEMNPEIYEQVQRSMTERFAPSVSFTLEAPASAVPGQTVHLVAHALNTGKGPATEALASVTTPFGHADSFDLDVLKVGEARSTSPVSFTIAPDACPQVLESSAQLSFKDFANNSYTATDTKHVQVLDITPPVLSVVVT